MPKDNRKVRDIMTPNPQTVTEKDSIRDVARIMADRDTGVVPVVDGKKIIGLITDRDIVVRLVAAGKDLANARVNEVMTKNVRSVKEDTPVSEVFDLMGKAEIRRVTVVDRNDEIIGIVSIGDLAKQTKQDGQIGQTIEHISEGRPNN
ncbi:MAG: CBS domain-containing protein [Thermoanaerobaculia bacterium]